MHNLDDYAWYEVGQRRYYNKIHALFDHDQSRLPIHWNVNDADYDQHDWTKEPDLDLESYYAQRAHDIRNSYDYLVLHFSGGSDSGNVLETFIRNKIHLDEILVRGSFSTVDPKQGLVDAVDQYSEVMVQSIPLAQWAKDNHMPHVKITVVDTVKTVYEYYTKTPDWVEKNPWALTPSQVIKINLDMLSPHYAKLADQGLRVGHIVGVEKPHIYRHKNYFYTRFLDSAFMDWVSIHNSASFRPQYIECFYWSKNCIPLQIKQLHVLKRYIKQHGLRDHEFDFRTGRPYERMVANALYRRTMPLLVEHDKDPFVSVIKSRDIWFAKDQFTDAFKNYQRGIDYLGTLTNKDWHTTDTNFWNNGIKGIYSKTRYLGA